MSGTAPRGRGRARGRGRGEENRPQAQQPGHPGQASGQQRFASTPGPGQRPVVPGRPLRARPRQDAPQGAWNRGPRPQQAMAESAPPPQATQGRAYCRGSERSAISTSKHAPQEGNVTAALGALSLGSSGGNGNGSNGNGNGNGGEDAPLGRGLSRARGRVLQDSSVAILRPHNNTKQGTSGAPIKLLVNYFEMEKKIDWNLYQYDLAYVPKPDTRQRHREVMEIHFYLFGKNFVFDVMNIFTTERLPANMEPLKTTLGKDEYTVTVTLVKELSPLNFQYMAILNRILRNCQSAINLKQIDRHYFDVSQAKSISNLGLRVFPGYHTAIRQHEEKILLNADIVHKFERTTSMLDLIVKARNNEEIASLKGCIVMCRYNNLTYKCDDILFEKSPKSTFSYNGKDITYLKYFKDKHKIDIRDHNQPLVFSRPNKRQQRSGITEIYLIPELLSITGIPDEVRNNFHSMKELAEYTRMNVDKRISALKAFNRTLCQSPKVQEDLTNWGLKLSSELLKVNGRVLPDEDVYMRDRSRGPVPLNHDQNTAEWSRNMRDKSMFTVIELKNWVCFCHERNERSLQEFLTCLTNAGRSFGMKVAPPQVVMVRNYVELSSYLPQYTSVQMVMVIMDRNLESKYGLIKKTLACTMGVLSQCVRGITTTKKGLMSVASKIVVQMNAKLGGEPWRIKQSARTAMVIGYDAYHDSVTRGSSYGAVVSSIDEFCTRYYGQVNEHTSREEISDRFASYIRNSLEVYHSNNEGRFPGTIIVYRDGVGEGQEAVVKQQEIPQINKVLRELSPNKKIALVFIVVTKRINTRMFAVQQNKYVNPRPATVLDHTITLPERYDFFLISQNVTQGTVSPTSFNVLEDTSSLAPDQVQRLTYKFTHLYFNWQGTIRVPAPCLYAHKLAYMTGCGTHTVPHVALREKLWFI